MNQAVAGRPQSGGEEIAISISHGIGMLGAVAVTPVLIVNAVRHGSAIDIVGASIFAAALILLYFSSTLYHALSAGRAKRLFQVFDHSAIFLLIAGTYTPFTLGVLGDAWGWSLFGIIWGLALLGITLKSVYGMRYERLSTFLYVAMGWLIIVAIKPLWLNVPGWGVFWLAAGGLAYTAGVVFFIADGKVRYAHFIWHMFVIAGSACHCVAVLKYSV